MVAAHNCEAFGVSLTVLMLKSDWETQVEKEYKKHDPETGLLVSENEVVTCRQAN